MVNKHAIFIITGSPFTCQVVDLSCVSAYGDGVDRCPVNSLTTFKITTAGQVS